MCRTLRVLNAVRQFEIGIPLSIQQFKVLAENLFHLKSAFFSLCMPSLPVIPVALRSLVLVFRKWPSWKFTIILSDRHYFPLHLKICQSTCMRWQFVQICSGAYTNSSCRKTRQCTSAPSGSAHIWVFRSKQGLCRVLLTCKHHCRFCT